MRACRRAPTDGRDAYGHRWAATFPPDGPPRCRRFGPAPVRPRADGEPWFVAGDITMTAGAARGHGAIGAR